MEALVMLPLSVWLPRRYQALCRIGHTIYSLMILYLPTETVEWIFDVVDEMIDIMITIAISEKAPTVVYVSKQ